MVCRVGVEIEAQTGNVQLLHFEVGFNNCRTQPVEELCPWYMCSTARTGTYDGIPTILVNSLRPVHLHHITKPMDWDFSLAHKVCYQIELNIADIEVG